jgi:hypothetical protein
MFANPTALPALPERVRVICMWSRWAAQVAAGKKTIETRTWEWPYEPGWLAIHASLKADDVKAIPMAIRAPFEPVPEVAPGALCALVWVTRCRVLVESDQRAALLFRPGLWAWELAHIQRLSAVKMRGPQKFSSVARAVIERAK